jgi:adenosine deaminase
MNRRIMAEFMKKEIRLGPGMKYPPDFIREIPKTDLHLHLDGSLRLNTLIELATEQGVTLPSYTETGLRELVFKERYQDLGDYLKGFQYTTAVMQTKEALERAACELGQDNIREGVCYVEVRFAPQLHVNGNLTFLDVMKAVNEGLKKAQQEYNATDRVKQGEAPVFHYGIIVSALRMFKPTFSEYYRRLFGVHSFSSDDYIFRLASLELAKAALKIRDDGTIPIVGFDLAGQEAGYPAYHHKAAYEYCHHHFMKKTVHAGEAYGAESIFQAITELHANRIGHGFYLFDENRIEDNHIMDKSRYIQDLSNYIADRRITMEICLSSNMDTNPSLKNIQEHSLKSMLEHDLSVTICTDNRLMSNTTVIREYKLAVENFNIPPKRLKDIVIYGFKRSFFPDSYMEKKKYCRRIIELYQKLEKKYAIEC